jgi:hypothetical protein
LRVVSDWEYLRRDMVPLIVGEWMKKVEEQVHLGEEESAS